MTPENVTGQAQPERQMAGTMQAIVQDRYGSADVLELREVARPEPAADELLIEVHAAGVDRGVEHLMTGEPYLVRLGFGLRRPKQPTPGLDVAGRVVAIGAATTRFRVGDEVMGIATGAYAEYAVAKETKLVHKPAMLSFTDAAVVPISGGTALQALTDQGHVQPSERVLVLGASGGVGSYAVQIAVALGARVTGVASAAKADMVRGLGAERVIDHRTEDFDADGPVYDLIIDAGGRNPIRRLRKALTREGRLVIVGGEDGNKVTGGIGRQLRAALLSPFVRHDLGFFIQKESGEQIDRVVAHIETGAVVPAASRTFPLAKVPDAMQALASGELVGKAAIVVR
ncbi:MAG: NAD(P)-dependent alcohol dehydrogenase [Acidimicrobiales bacterium]